MAELVERVTIPMMQDGWSACDRRINPATIAPRRNNLLTICRPSPARVIRAAILNEAPFSVVGLAHAASQPNHERIVL